MTLEDFAKAVTGLGNVECDIAKICNKKGFSRVGKERETKEVFVDKPDTYGKEGRRAEVLKSLKESGELKDGWELWSDGCSTQQPKVKHRMVLCRYVKGESNG